MLPSQPVPAPAREVTPSEEDDPEEFGGGIVEVLLYLDEAAAKFAKWYRDGRRDEHAFLERLVKRIQRYSADGLRGKSRRAILRLLQAKTGLWLQEGGRDRSRREKDRLVKHGHTMAWLAPHWLYARAEARLAHGGKKINEYFGKRPPDEQWIDNWLYGNADNLATLHSIWDGKPPSKATILRWLRDEYGTRRERTRLEGKQPWLETYGAEAKCAGDVLQVDFTTNPCVKAAAWGPADKNGKTLEEILIVTDMASGMTWLEHLSAASENDPQAQAALRHIFIHEIKAGARIIVSDLTAVLFANAAALSHTKPGCESILNNTAFFILAMGTQPYTTRGHNPAGKGSVERHCSLFHGAMYGVNCGRLADRKQRIAAGEITAPDARHLAWFESPLDYHRAIEEVERRMQGAVLERAGKPRMELWHDAASNAWRETRALRPDAWEFFQKNIRPRIKVMALQLSAVKGRFYNCDSLFKLTPADGYTLPEETTTALVVPCGVLAADNPEEARVFVVEKGKSNGFRVRLAGTCKIAASAFGQVPGARPVFGEGYWGKPATDESHRARAGNLAAAEQRSTLVAQIQTAREKKELEFPNMEPGAPLPFPQDDAPTLGATGTDDAKGGA